MGMIKNDTPQNSTSYSENWALINKLMKYVSGLAAINNYYFLI